MTSMVNCHDDILEEICSDDIWYEIIKQKNHIRVPGANPIDIKNYNVDGQPKSIWEILDRDGVNIHDRSAVLNEIKNDPICLLEKPQDIFFLENISQYPRNVKSDYGTMVASAIGDYRPLVRHWKWHTQRGERYSWNEFFANLGKKPVIPSNALVIVDRYLFSFNKMYDQGTRTDYRNGVRNIFDILSSLLPEKFCGPYQVLILFNEDAISNGATFDDVVKSLQKIKKIIARPYPIDMEVLTIGKDAGEFWGESHDRQIISNYFRVTASHGFSAFIPEENNENNLINKSVSFAVWPQDLSFESLYCGIDNPDQDNRSLPADSNKRYLKKVKEYISSLKGNDNGFHYACNGNRHLDISQMKNRLVMSIDR